MKLWQWSLLLGMVVMIATVVTSPKRERGAPIEAFDLEDSFPESEDLRPAEVVPAQPLRAKRQSKRVPVKPSVEPPATPEPSSVADVDEPATDLVTKAQRLYPQSGGPLDGMKGSYSSTSADSTAAALETKIRTVLKREDVVSSIESVACHAKVCRIRMNWKESELATYMAVHMLLVRHVGSHISVEPLSGDPRPQSASIDVYVLRPGVELGDVQ